MNRARAVPRCPRCALHTPICLCDTVQPLPTRTRVVVVMHFKEAQKQSNTGRLAPLCLADAQVRLRADREQPLDLRDLADSTRRAVLLYPDPDAPVLDAHWAAADPRPVTLVVPDGNWRQTVRTCKREPALADLPRVRLPLGAPSSYRLRRHPDPARISTLEAIARAVGVLDGPAPQALLERTLAVFVERTLWSRGTLPEADVTGGIPRKDW
ncbi:MAG: DTW domain-containing protein [Myxococcales bacterium]|nr:DTW domain-containing protein [Myxococcales bacterium]MCB9522570.1 DTW domain-containing protein [Myxococcales bacterium]